MVSEIADEGTYLVVRNDEEQYSIWSADRELPLGWHAEGTRGTRPACLDHIGRIWTDMRPASLRRRMEAEQAGQHGHAQEEPQEAPGRTADGRVRCP